MNFIPQYRDKVHGNNFIQSSFRNNLDIHHKHLKEFLAYHKPEIETRDRRSYSNRKNYPILILMNYIFTLIWLLGVEISVDVIMIRFKRYHKDNNCITYNAEGDDLQANAFFQDSLTYQIFIGKVYSPHKYTDNFTIFVK